MKKLSILLLLSVFFLSCAKDDLRVENLNGNRVVALGHAGMGFYSDYPINSFESIMKCLNLGMDGTELDVQMTRDSILVVFHGEDLSSHSNLKGFVNSLTWAEMKNGIYNSKPYSSEHAIISLEQLFSGMENPQDYEFHLDCKYFTNNSNTNELYETFINSVIRLCGKYHMTEKVSVLSHDGEFLRMFRKKSGDFKLFLETGDFEGSLPLVSMYMLSGISISAKKVTAEQVSRAHQAGILISLWETNSRQENLEAIEKNPDYVQTDNARSLIRLIRDNDL